MIALLLLMAQAPAGGSAPPVAPAASAPTAEQWELDQIRFQPPADTSVLKPALETAHSMAAVVDLLNRLHIPFERARVTSAASDFPDPIRRQIEALPPGEPFVVAQPQFTTANAIVARRGGSATIAPAAATPAAPPAAIAAAEELLRETRSEEQMRSIVDQGAAVMRSGANINAEIDRNDAMKLQRAKNPQAWDAAVAKVGGMQADLMTRIVGELLPELHRRAVAAYAENYTVAEMRQLIAFYRSPVGRKSVERGPAIAAATGIWFQREFAQRLAAAMATLQPEIQRMVAPLMQQPGK